MDAPGLFFFLVRDGLVTLDAIAPLLAKLPPEQYVRTSVRDGEGFDSTRWPIARDAALADLLAQRFDEPEVAQARAEIAAAAGDRLQLRALARRASARLVASCGGDASLFSQLWSDATPEELALFAEPPWPPRAAAIVAELCATHDEAADGLYAYHCHRDLPGPSAEAAAPLARRALEEGRIDARALIDAALALVGGRGRAPFFALEPSPAASSVVDAIVDACEQVRRFTGADSCTVLGEGYAIPALPTGGVVFMIAAGPRALVLLTFAALPPWTSRVASFRARPLFTRMGRSARFELVLAGSERADDRAPAAVASLCFFVELSLDSHLVSHPEDERVFTILDDAALGRMFD